GGSVVGRSACGSFLGSYTTNEGTIDITDLRFRLRDDCTDAARSQAARTIETLSAISRFEVLPAGLALQDENGTTRLAFTPDLSLGRRIWTPTVIYDQNEEARFEGDELSTSAVQFSRQDAEGRSICRPFVAQSLRSGLALNVDDDTIEYLFKGCPKNDAVDWTGIERAFMNALKDAASHALRGSELELKDVDGRTLMKLEPQADLVGPTWVVTRLGNNRLRAPTGDIPLSATFDEIGLVFGDTGATVESIGSNYYQTFYETPQATRIKIEPINLRRDVEGRACNGAQGKRKQTPACKQEALFLKLLSQVDGYIVRDEILQLLKGNRVVVRLEPEPFANAGDVE
ncbi:MAG: META domain-containing protein, partial [Chloroflexota bacterium]